MIADFFQSLSNAIDKYSAVFNVLYSCGIFFSGYIIKNLKDRFHKRKLKKIIGLNYTNKNVVLCLPCRERELYGGKVGSCIIWDEMLIVSEMQKCISDLSDTFKLTVELKYSFESHENVFFFGGYHAHAYVKNLFIKFARENKIVFSTRQETYDNIPNSEKVLFEVNPNHGITNRYIYL